MLPFIIHVMLWDVKHGQSRADYLLLCLKIVSAVILASFSPLSTLAEVWLAASGDDAFHGIAVCAVRRMRPISITCCNATAVVALSTWPAMAFPHRPRAGYGCATSASLVRFASCLLAVPLMCLNIPVEPDACSRQSCSMPTAINGRVTGHLGKHMLKGDTI